MNLDRVSALNILELHHDASKENIRDAYRTLAKVWHPDRFIHDPKLHHIAQEKLKNINNAYEWLNKHPFDDKHSILDNTIHNTSSQWTMGLLDELNVLYLRHSNIGTYAITISVEFKQSNGEIYVLHTPYAENQHITKGTPEDQLFIDLADGISWHPIKCGKYGYEVYIDQYNLSTVHGIGFKVILHDNHIEIISDTGQCWNMPPAYSSPSSTYDHESSASSPSPRIRNYPNFISALIQYAFGLVCLITALAGGIRLVIGAYTGSAMAGILAIIFVGGIAYLMFRVGKTSLDNSWY